jgi:glycosyltransferase involved in cell wall biosynthesis
LLERQLGVALPRAEVVWNPFNVPWDTRLSWPTRKDELALACVARLDPRAKGQDLLLQVLAMPHWRDRPLSVSLFGRGTWEQGLKQLAHSLGVSSRVRFCGHVDDIAGVWADHHALILPSRYEGLPLCLIEAMLCGRFGIVTDVGGNRELLENGVNGFVAAAPSVPLLDEALERAWNQRAHWAEIGEAASKSIRAVLPADPAQVFADQLLSLA